MCLTDSSGGLRYPSEEKLRCQSPTLTVAQPRDRAAKGSPAIFSSLIL